MSHSPSTDHNAWQYVIMPHREHRFDATRALNLVENILGTFGVATFVIEFYRIGAVASVWDLSKQPDPVSHELFRANCPDAFIDPKQSQTLLVDSLPLQGAIIPLKQYNRADFPLLYIDEIQANADPLDGLFQAAKVLDEHEMARFLVFVKKRQKPVFHQVGQFRNSIQQIQELQDRKTYLRAKHAHEHLLEARKAAPWYACYVALEVFAKDQERIITIADTLIAQLNGFERKTPNLPTNSLVIEDSRIVIYAVNNEHDFTQHSAVSAFYDSLFNPKQERFIRKYQSFFELREVASLWHIPHQDFSSDNVMWSPVKADLPVELAGKEEGVFLGGAFYRGRIEPVFLHPEDRNQHMNIVGKTRMGKSTLMHHMIRHDIAQGRGVCVIDPHGSLVHSVLQHSIPPEREDDVIVLDLNDPRIPLPLNVLAGSQSYAGIGRVVNIIERFYQVTGVQMDRFIRAGIKVMRYIPHATMKDLQQFLIKEDFRMKVLEVIEEDDLFHLWDTQYHQQKPGQRTRLSDPIINRINPFYANPYLYPSLCHPDCLDFSQLINENRIVLISLRSNSEVVPHKEQHFVGSLLVSLIQMVGMNRQEGSEPYYVYVDEIQNLVTSSLDVIFFASSQVRGVLHCR